jgi:hypothetical protein
MFTLDLDPRIVLLSVVKQFWPAKDSRARISTRDSDGKKMYREEALVEFSEQRSIELFTKEMGSWEEGTMDDKVGMEAATEMLRDVYKKIDAHAGTDDRRAKPGEPRPRLYKAFMIGRLSNDFIVNYDPESKKYITNLDVEIQFEEVK